MLPLDCFVARAPRNDGGGLGGAAVLAAQRFDHAHVVGPVGAVPMQRMGNQVVVVGGGDAVAGVGQPFERVENCRICNLQVAEPLLEKRAPRAGRTPSQLGLNRVRRIQPIVDLVRANSASHAATQALLFPPFSWVASASPSRISRAHPGAAPRVVAHRNAGAADDQRPPLGEGRLQLIWRIGHRSGSYRGSPRKLPSFTWRQKHILRAQA